MTRQVVLPSRLVTLSASGKCGFRGSMASLRDPLSTLRLAPHGTRRTARGRCDSLRLHRRGLAPPAPCRSPGALPTRVDADSPGYRIPRRYDSMHRWRFSPQEASDERGGPNQPFGPDCVGASEICQQVRRRRAGPSASGPRAGAGGPFTRRSGGAERHGPANVERLGASLQCGGDRRPEVVSPAWRRAAAE